MRSSVKTVGLAVLTLAVLVPANSHALWFLCDMKEAWDAAWKARESREALIRAADPIQPDLENFEEKRD